MNARIGRIPAYLLFVAFAAGALVTGVITFRRAGASPPPQAVIQAAPVPEPLCEHALVRAHGYAGVEPLLASERPCESVRYAGLKAAIGQLADSCRQHGQASSVAVYLRVFGHGDWISYNDSARFEAGPLLDVPVMMAYLRAAQSDAAVLDTRYRIDRKDRPVVGGLFHPKEPIAPEQDYAVSDLIHRSVAGADEEATRLLWHHVDRKVLQRICTDLSVPVLDPSGPLPAIGARDYSMFMRTLFNASYLGIPSSEFAVARLSEREFGGGIRAGLPDSVRVAHVFGEGGVGPEKELHEAAIVYFAGRTYLLTIMTRGNDEARLEQVLRSLSGLVYRTVSADRG